MANELIPVSEVAGRFLAVLNKHAEQVPAERRAEFKTACFEWVGGRLFQGPVTVPEGGPRYV